MKVYLVGDVIDNIYSHPEKFKLFQYYDEAVDYIKARYIKMYQKGIMTEREYHKLVSELYLCGSIPGHLHIKELEVN